MNDNERSCILCAGWLDLECDGSDDMKTCVNYEHYDDGCYEQAECDYREEFFKNGYRN